MYILGDFNINVLDRSNISKRYKEICSFHGLKQVIESYTRITDNTSTLIDHVLTNSVENMSQHGVLEIALSDHYAIYCTRKTQKQKYHKHKFITVRSLKRYSKTLLLEKLNTLVFPDYSSYENMDTAYSEFTEEISKIINEIAPFKTICVKNITSEWVDDEIFEAIRTRDKLFKKSKKSRLHTDGVNFRRARNRLQTMIKNKKQNFICNKLTENIAKPKELWKTLSQLGLQSKNKTASKICLKENGEVKFEPKSNCEIFKQFFENL